jgi:PAS domain S-box-containing protein
MKDNRKKRESRGVAKEPALPLSQNQIEFLQDFLNLFCSDNQVGFFRISRDGKLAEINSVMANMLGTTFSASNSPKISSQIKKILLSLVKPGEVVTGLEKKVLIKANKHINLRFAAKSFLTGKNEIITGFAENIKEIKKSVKSNETTVKSLIDCIDNPVWSLNSEGCLTIFNKAFNKHFYQRFGRYPKTGMAVFKTILKKDIEDWKAIFDIALKGKKISLESKIRLEGVLTYFDSTAYPVFDQKNKIIGVTLESYNISERKITENVLIDGEEKFRQFAENTADAFVLCTVDAVLYVNPAFQKIFGRSLKEAYEHNHIPDDWVHPDDREKIIGFFRSKEYIKTGKFNGQYRIIKPDGTISWIWERSFPVLNDKGKIIRYISMASDITLQKKLEFDLLQTKTQQQAIIDNIPHLAWLKDIDGKYVSVNESFAKSFNLKKEELIGKTDSDICHPDIAELYAYNDYIVLKTKKQQQFDQFVDTPAGTVYSETIKTPVINSKGEVIGVTGISRDITYYKRLEQQLRANDDRINALLKNSTDSITVINNEAEILFDSSFVKKVTGVPYEDKKEISFLQLVSESHRYLIKNAVEQVTLNPDLQQKVEFSCLKQDGSTIYFESFFSNHLKNVLIGGIVVNSRDITERKISEIKEKEYQDNLVFLENTALEFLSMSSANLIYDYIGSKIHELIPDSVSIISSYDENENCLIIQNITGIEKFIGIIEDILGQNPLYYKSQLTKQLRRELFLTSNKLHALNGGLYNIFNRQIDFMICKALEKLISLNNAYGMGIVREDKLLGSVVLLTRYAHDIKDKRIIETLMYQASIALQKRILEKEFIAAKEKAEESDKLKTAFLANMSHEIRTPVNGIIGFSQLLQDANLTEDKRKEFIEIIKANADSLITLIDDILDVSIIQEGLVKLRKATININLILDEVNSSFSAPKYKDKGIKFEVHKTLPDETAVMLADPLRIKQVLTNLISNAFKFTDKGSIAVGYVIEPDFIRFYVKDTGIGILAEKRETIFQRFTQGDTSYTRKFSGSGLGLAISKGLIEVMGGAIWVSSKPGEGSEFCFTIPHHDTSWKSPDSLAKSAESNPSLFN